MQEGLKYEYSKRREKSRKTPEQAHSALMRLASRAEKSSGDAMRLMRGWGLDERDAQKVLARLIRDRFIDDRRYAEAYSREKSSLSGWGAHKIRRMLLSKGVAPATVDHALAGLDRERMGEKLRTMLSRKSAIIKSADEYDRKAKLVRYALSAGYGYEEAVAAVEEVMSLK